MNDLTGLLPSHYATQSLEELLFLHRRENAKFDNLCRFPRTRLWNSFIEVLWLSSNSVPPEIVICLAGHQAPPILKPPTAFIGQLAQGP